MKHLEKILTAILAILVIWMIASHIDLIRVNDIFVKGGHADKAWWNLYEIIDKLIEIFR